MLMFKYFILFILLSFVNAFTHLNSISIVKKPFNSLNNANHLITKYKINEIKNDRLKINNLVNHVVTTYYLNFLFARRRHCIIYKSTNNTI